MKVPKLKLERPYQCTLYLLKIFLFFGLALITSAVFGADISLPGIDIDLTDNDGVKSETATAIKIVLTLTILSLAPSIVIVMSSFTRIIIVLSILRHALGMQQTPPNTVLVSLALFLTVFNMMPVMQQINIDAYQPYMANKIDTTKALNNGMEPLRDFMIRQTREQDLALMVDLAKDELPDTVSDISNLQLIPAFMLSELKTAFQAGFMIFLPFLLIDIVVASILMSMGMMMVPPMMISLPIKIMMFVLIDGWNLVVQSVMSSFH
ncbi:MAG: flagellar type III secretion system pore protein FliP [Candidatus Sedimenticola sp. (ex Thyasira tokunagai)]